MNKRILAVLRKEIAEIWRDPYTLGVALFLPLLLLILFGYAINTDVKDIQLGVLDQDRSTTSRQYLQTFVNSGYFQWVRRFDSQQELTENLDRDQVEVALVIPAGFERDLTAGQSTAVQTIIDGSYTPFAQVAFSYVNAINAAYNQKIQAAFIDQKMGRRADNDAALTVNTRVRYNPTFKSANFIIPGLFGVILMAFPPMLSALAIIREKERGSIQQIFLSPTQPIELILGKLIPYGVIAFMQMLIVLAGGLLLFQIPFRGSIALFLGASVIYVLATVSIGLLVSAIVRTQVAAMLLSLVLTVMPSMLFSGFIFPVHTMPAAMQLYTNAFPTRYFIDISRAIALKGQGLEAIGSGLLFLAGYAVILILISALLFKKRIG
jgi:ABC-2 type transport system permease protein